MEHLAIEVDSVFDDISRHRFSNKAKSVFEIIDQITEKLSPVKVVDCIVDKKGERIVGPAMDRALLDRYI